MCNFSLITLQIYIYKMLNKRSYDRQKDKGEISHKGLEENFPERFVEEKLWSSVKSPTVNAAEIGLVNRTQCYQICCNDTGKHLFFRYSQFIHFLTKMFSLTFNILTEKVSKAYEICFQQPNHESSLCVAGTKSIQLQLTTNKISLSSHISFPPSSLNLPQSSLLNNSHYIIFILYSFINRLCCSRALKNNFVLHLVLVSAVSCETETMLTENSLTVR